MVLLITGADSKAKYKAANAAFHCAKYNQKLKGTDALKKLEDASK